MRIAIASEVFLPKIDGITNRLANTTAELVRLAKASPVVAAVCYNVRFYPLNQEARRRIASGQAGRVFHVTGSYTQDSQTPSR